MSDTSPPNAARRNILHGTAAGGASMGLLSGCGSLAPAQASTEMPATAAAAFGVAASAQAAVGLTVNTKRRTLTMEPRTNLVEALRGTLGLTGTKIGCNHGQCGACTVLVDGRRMNACLVLAVSVEGTKITTIEGLAGPGGTPHPMQQAFAEKDALQCGYCTPGQVVSAVACIAEGHASSAAEIREYMGGNLCRCAAYPNERSHDLSVKAVEVFMGNSDLPIAPISGGSVTSASAGSAVHVACLKLADEIVRTVVALKDNPLSGVEPAQVKLVEGTLQGPGGRSMSLLDALKATPRGEAVANGQYAHPELTEQALRTTYKGGVGVAGPVTKTHAMFAFGAQFVEARVHRWTHEIRVPRIHGAFAAGTILNRKTAHSQLMGAMIWGIGSALHEHTLVDRARARFLNTDITAYLIPVNADIGEVNVQMLDERDDFVNPLGLKGIGELGIGARLRQSMPFTTPPASGCVPCRSP